MNAKYYTILGLTLFKLNREISSCREIVYTSSQLLIINTCLTIQLVAIVICCGY